MMALPPAKPRPPPPDKPEPNDWRTKLHAETREQKHARLEASYPPRDGTTHAHWMHRKFPCIERPGLGFLEAVRKRAKAKAKAKARTPNPTDGQGHGLPPHPDIPF